MRAKPTPQRLLNRSTLLPNLTSGLVIGIQLPIFALMCGILLGLNDMAQAVGMALLSSFLIMFLSFLFSKSDKIYNDASPCPLILIAVILSSMVTELNQHYPQQNPIPTLMMTILISTLSAGFIAFLLGKFRLGKLVKFFPYPIIGGFFASFGWFIFIAGFELLMDTPPTLKTMFSLFNSNHLVMWLPAIGAAIVLYIGLEKAKKRWFLLAYIITFTAIFYAVLYVLGMGVETAQNRGYLFHLPATTNLIPKLGYVDIHAVQWNLIGNHVIDILFVCLIVLCDIFLSFSSFEIVSKKDINVDYELKFLGLSNIFIGLCGGVPGYINLPASIISYKMQGDSRFTTLMCLGIMFIVLMSGSTLLNLTPKLLIAIILFYVGLSAMKEWLIDVRKAISHLDYILLFSVFLISILQDIFTGIFVGIIISGVLFLIRYCNLSILHKEGTQFRSHVDYSPVEEHVLANTDDAIHVVQLRNYLFFGNIIQLSESLNDVFLNPNTRFIIIDFKHVTGEDISVHNSLVRLIQSAHINKIELVFSNIPLQDFEVISKFSAGMSLKNFESVDHALEYCETKLIESSDLSTVENANFIEQLERFLKNKTHAEKIASLFQREQFPKDTLICRQGEEAREFYFVNQGSVDVFLVHPDGTKLRVSKIKSGALTGEMGYYLKHARSAEMRAGTRVVIYRLLYSDFELFTQQYPDAALIFLNYLGEKMARKLDATNKLLLRH